VWFVLAPIIALVVYFVLTPVLRRVLRRMQLATAAGVVEAVPCSR
jgi:O-antigen ligase